MESSGNESSSGPSSPQARERWWKIFKNRTEKNAQGASQSSSSVKGAVFNIPLQDSLACASVAISQVAPDNKARIYGHIPVVVAKTGLFLKENGTNVEGVFRKPGSEKRVRELESAFSTPPLYGKDLLWDKSYSVHDAATVLKRFLNNLPEPVVPFELYAAFQDALPRPEDGAPRSQLESDSAVNAYKGLIASLPPASQHLLFYLLDVLGVFARKSDVNRMTASNLATTFQPGLLRHPADLHGPPLPPHLTALATGSSAGGAAVAAAAAAASAGSVPSTPAAATHAPATTPAQAQQQQQGHFPEDDPAAIQDRIQAEQKEYKKSIEVIEFLILHQTSFELQLPKPQPKSQAPPAPSTAAAAAAGASSSPAQSHSSQRGVQTQHSTGPHLLGASNLQPMSSKESEADYPQQRSGSPLAMFRRPSPSRSPEASQRSKVSLGRRNSDRGTSGPEHRRLRRKKQQQQQQQPQLNNSAAVAEPTPASTNDHEPSAPSKGVRRAKTLPSRKQPPSTAAL